MVDKVIYIQDTPYYYYETYDTGEEAHQIAKDYKEEDKKNKYFIIKTETGAIDPEIKYRLYMTKVQKIIW